jgi:hypothetical protein
MQVLRAVLTGVRVVQRVQQHQQQPTEILNTLKRNVSKNSYYAGFDLFWRDKNEIGWKIYQNNNQCKVSQLQDLFFALLYGDI